MKTVSKNVYFDDVLNDMVTNYNSKYQNETYKCSI